MQSDLLVVGGAAGSSWGGPAGWAAFAYVTATEETKKLVAVAEDVRLQDADVLPFLAALEWFDKHHHVEGQPTRVLFCSDSPALVRAGNDPTERTQLYWIEVEAFEKRGYQIFWVWDSRPNNPAVFEEAERVRRTLLAHAV